MSLAELPITPYLETICRTLKESPSRFLVLTAETAAGKSTAVPPALLDAFPKKIVMLEPRRLAVLSIASRIAELLGEEVGGTVGYKMHLESRLSRATRLEIITEAILTRRLQTDPALEDVSVVVIDEFHERSIHADLALAFLKEAMELRDDLFVIVMSATIETKRLSAYLGTQKEPAPVICVPGRQFPVEIEYAGAVSMAGAICAALPKHKGQTVLAFLPGIAEIRRCKRELEERGICASAGAEILILHSSVTLAEQRRVLAPPKDGMTRVILSSAIAETSLTVPGVSLVIDSGLSRLSRMNVALGMERLVTEPESMFSAAQRAGRAGRLGPGKCIRLWNKTDVRLEATPAEILRTDITTLVLECAQWGAVDFAKINWLEPPSAAAWNEAVLLLKKIGCLFERRITAVGKACLELGVHPRLGCVALSGFAAQCVEYTNYAKSAPEIKKRFTDDLTRRVAAVCGTSASNVNIARIANAPTDASAQPSVMPAYSAAHAKGSTLLPQAKNAALALLAGFPDRIARQTEAKGLYQFASGRIARLPADDIAKNAVLPQWIVAPEVDAGDSEGRIHSYHALCDADALEWLSARAQTKIIAEFEGNRISKKEITCYGKLVLSEKKCAASPEDYALALCAQVRQKGLAALPLDERAESLIVREQFYAQQKGVPAKSEEKALCATLEEWLVPFLGGRTKIDAETVFNALYWYLNGAAVDKDAPMQLTLPNGKKRRLVYERHSAPDDRRTLVIRPVLEVIIQQIFGCFETPKIMEMPVLLKLLSPARRPLQITDNLESFWNSTWPEICKEMKGRYPKHNWDYRVIEKEPNER